LGEGFIVAAGSPNGSQQIPEPPEKHDVAFIPARIITHIEQHPEAKAGLTLKRATTLYNKHQELGESWNPWHPFANAFDYQQARAFGSQRKTWVDKYLRAGLDGDATTSFQNASELWELLRNLDFGLGNSTWFEAPGIHGSIYSRDILQCMQFLLSHLPFADDLDFAPVKLFDDAGNRIYSEMSSCNW
jgi:hypothetical protein